MTPVRSLVFYLVLSVGSIEMPLNMARAIVTLTPVTIKRTPLLAEAVLAVLSSILTVLLWLCKPVVDLTVLLLTIFFPLTVPCELCDASRRGSQSSAAPYSVNFC